MSHLPLRPLVLVLAACSLALLLNPYGVRLVYFPIEMQAGWIRAIGPEWQSPFQADGWRLTTPAHVLPSVAPTGFFAYLALLAGALLVARRRWRQADLLPAAIMGLWLALSLRHLRTVADATLLTAPCVAAALTRWRVGRGMVVGSVALVLGLAGLSLGYAPRQTGLWREGQEPVCVAAALERLGVEGPVLTSPSLVQWILYRFHPRLQTDHTWEFVGGAKRIEERRTAWDTPVSLQHYWERINTPTSGRQTAVGLARVASSSCD